MLRMTVSVLIGALLIAPLGFGTSAGPVAVIARALFVALGLAAAILGAAGLRWSRRWPV